MIKQIKSIKVIPPVQQSPASGWQFVRLTDLNAVDPLGIEAAKCDRCNRSLRFIHTLEHADWPKPLRVGCCCAVRLAVGYDARQVEREEANRAGRRMRFLNPARWRRSAKGNLTRKVRDVRVTVFPQHDNYFKFIIDDSFSTRVYESEADAMRGSFEIMDRRSAEGGIATVPTRSAAAYLGRSKRAG